MPLDSCIGATYALQLVGLSYADFWAFPRGTSDPYGGLNRGAARRDLSPAVPHRYMGIHNRVMDKPFGSTSHGPHGR